MGATGKGWGSGMETGQRGRQGSQPSILLLGLRWLPLLLVRALLVRGTEQLGGCLVFWRFPMVPTAGQPSPPLHQWGQEELGASAGPGVCVRRALSPRCSDEPPHTHPKLTKEQPCWDCPTRVLLGGAAQPGQARPSLSSGRDRKEPVFIVCGHTMGCAQAGAFPSASVNICQPPFQPGAE